MGEGTLSWFGLEGSVMVLILGCVVKGGGESGTGRLVVREER